MLSATVLLGVACLAVLVAAGIVIAVVVVYQWPRSRNDEHHN